MDSRSRVAVASTDPRVQAALQDYFARLDRGETLDVEAFVAEHPDVALELRSFIAFDEEARRLAAGPPSVAAAEPRPSAELTTHSAAGRQSRTADAARATRSAEDLPDVFGRYRIQKKLGAGAMGAVYLADDTFLERRVALKVPTFDRDPEGELLRRFHREARAVANLKHPNLCAVYDVGEIDGRHYISMEFVPGRKLQEFIRPDKPLPEKQAMAVVRKIALGMQEAHTHGVIHRDLKPDNIMVNEQGEPVVMDFGLVHKLQAEDSTRLTQMGTLVGSPAYMSKEQVEGDPDKLTGASDQYSLGVILYQLLTSRLPFTGGLHAVLGAILTKEPSPPRTLRPDLNPHLEAVCLKMMAKSPEDRYPSMKAAAEALAEVARRTPRAAGTVALTPETGAPAGGFVAEGLVATVLGDHTAPESASASFSLTATPNSSLVRPAPPRRPRSLLYGSLAGGLSLLLGVIVWFNLGGARVRVEVLSDDITATFEKETLTLDDGAHEFKVTAGEHHLHVETDGIKFDTDKFTLKRGANPVVTVERTASEVVAKFDDKPIGRRPRPSPSSRSGKTPVSPASNAGELPVGESIDLLAMVKFPEHAIAGNWRKVNGAVLGDPFSQQRFVVPVAITGSYKLTCQVTRRAGGGDISLILQVGDADCSMAYMDTVCGLDLLDGRRPGQLTNTSAAVVRKTPLVNGVSYKLEVSVIAQGPNAKIEAFLDGQRLISWEGATSLLSRDWSHSLPRGHSIGLHSYASALTVHSMKLEIDRGSSGRRLAVEGNPADAAVQSSGIAADGAKVASTPANPVANAASAPWPAGSSPGQEWSGNGLQMKFCWCPPGTFTMGSPASDKDGAPDERQVAVTLTQGFGLAKYEVTQGDWSRMMGTEPWKEQSYIGEGADYASTHVSWQDAQMFCRKLTEQEQQAGRLPVDWKFRLPTEAEWEYACRAGTRTRFSFGDDAAELSQFAWWGGFRGNGNARNEQYAHRVGLKRPNGWGLCDMHGNVWEWCEDVYVETLPGGTDPLVTTGGTNRALRGGGWFDPITECRSAVRTKLLPFERYHNFGFRPVAALSR